MLFVIQGESVFNGHEIPFFPSVEEKIGIEKYKYFLPPNRDISLASFVKWRTLERAGTYIRLHFRREKNRKVCVTLCTIK